jgi:phosphatidylglycerophosphatase A
MFTGYIPFASGTFGSAFALLFLLIPGFDNIYILSLTSVICFVLCSLTASKIIEKFGDDPSVLVVDEVIGMWVTLIVFKLLNGFSEPLSLISLIITFLMFRFFDIVKLQPAGYFDRMKNTFGILMDDAVAGVYAGIISYLIVLIIKLF